MPYNFCFIKFSPSQTVKAAEAGQTLFRAPLTQGFRVWGCNPSMNLSRIEEYPHAKFHRDLSSGLDFYSRYTHTHAIHIDFYISDVEHKELRFSHNSTPSPPGAHMAQRVMLFGRFEM
jgi:hypothetical protein